MYDGFSCVLKKLRRGYKGRARRSKASNNGHREADADFTGATSIQVEPEMESLKMSLIKGRVMTEFVFTDLRPHISVFLTGDWNNWKPLEMFREKRGENVFSVVTVVPIGYHEFCYIVDGKHTISRRHPLTIDKGCNWRKVHGPLRLRNHEGDSIDALSLPELIVESIRRVLVHLSGVKENEGPANIQHPAFAEEYDIESNRPRLRETMTRPDATGKKRAKAASLSSSPTMIIFSAVLLYSMIYGLYLGSTNRAPRS